MIVTFLCPSAPHPIGGVIALYEFANGMSRRGHQIHLVHAPLFRTRIDSLDDIAWFHFEPGIEHHLVRDDGTTPFPHADILFGSFLGPEYGHPVTIVQGFEMLHLGLEREGFRQPGMKVCIASWLVDAGQRFGVAPDQFEVVYMGIDHDRFHVTQPIVGRPPTVGILHSSHPAKGWKTGFRALELVHEREPDAQVLAFGTSEPSGPLPDWVTWVHNPGRRQLVDDIYNRCRVFVQSSDYEGFGFTAVEAMACGAALVTTDNGGSRDYALPGDTALVAPAGDAEGLADHMVTLLHDDALRIQLAENGQRFVQRFNWEQAAADLEACLEGYLADPDAYKHEPGPEREVPGQGGDPYALR